MAAPLQLKEALERPHRLGMIGGELEDQLAHCASFSFALAQAVGDRTPTTAVDLGTGGGLPGLALALDWPDTAWTLVDVRSNRAAEVERAALRLGLDEHRATVVAATAQELGHGARRASFDAAVARAFGPPSLVAECAAGLLRTGGVLVVSEPPKSTEDRWPAIGLEACGFAEPVAVKHEGRQFVILIKVTSTGRALPRLPARSDRGWP